MVVKKAVVPAAGLGTRLLPATKSQPKEMLPVGRKPVIHYVMEELERAGVEKVLVITGRKKRAIEDYLDSDPHLLEELKRSSNREILKDMLSFERLKLDYFFVRQKEQAGLGDAVRLAKGFVGDEPFVVALGDCIFSCEKGPGIIARMAMLWEESSLKFGDVSAVISVEEVPADEVKRYGIAKPGSWSGSGRWGEAFDAADLIEKPDPEEAPSRWGISGRYIFSPRIFDYIERIGPGYGGEIQLTDAIRAMAHDGHRVLCLKQTEFDRRYDIGTFESYFKAFISYALMDEELGERMMDYLSKIAMGERRADRG